MSEFLTGRVWESKPGWAKVHIDEDDDDAGFTTDWIPMVFMHTMGDKEAVELEKDTQVKLLLSHDRRDGVILGAIYSDVDKPPAAADSNTWVKQFSDGTILSYDKKNHILKAVVEGKIDITAKDDVKVKTDGKLDADVGGDATIKASRLLVDGDLDVTGKLSVVGDIQTSGTVDATTEVQALAGVIKLTMHKHLSATPGSPTGPSIP